MDHNLFIIMMFYIYIELFNFHYISYNVQFRF